jgi:transposase-like protein
MERQSQYPQKLRKWSDESMSSAFKAVKSGQMTLRSASKTFGVPRMTLSALNTKE